MCAYLHFAWYYKTKKLKIILKNKCFVLRPLLSRGFIYCPSSNLVR